MQIFLLLFQFLINVTLLLVIMGNMSNRWFRGFFFLLAPVFSQNLFWFLFLLYWNLCNCFFILNDRLVINIKLFDVFSLIVLDFEMPVHYSLFDLFLKNLFFLHFHLLKQLIDFCFIFFIEFLKFDL